MEKNEELQQWKREIKEFFEWNADLIERNQKVRELGHNIFVHDVPISIESLKLRLKHLKNLSIPKLKECEKVRKSLEESMKYRIKGLQLELKYFQDIQAGTLAGRFGSGSVSFQISVADDLLKKSMKEFYLDFK